MKKGNGDAFLFILKAIFDLIRHKKKRKKDSKHGADYTLRQRTFYNIGVPQVLYPKMNHREIIYTKIKNDYWLEDERDFIWIMCTTDEFVRVVAQSNDINFDFPPNADVYNKESKGQTWQYNTSEIRICHQGSRFTWDLKTIQPMNFVILQNSCFQKKMMITDAAMEKLKNIYESVRGNSNFGNGRFVRKILEEAETNLAE